MLTRRDNREQLYRQIVGSWLPTGSGLCWCVRPDLCGAIVWGRPSPDEVRELLTTFDGYRHLAPRFDILLDGSAVEGIDGDAMALVLAWLASNAAVLREHVHRRVGVISSGIVGLALAGMTTAVGIETPVVVVTDAREGFRMLSPEHGDALCDNVMRLADECRGVPPQLVAMRRALATTRGASSLAETARLLGLSTRTLQRVLGDAGVSFRGEQADARFRAAGELLYSDDKLAVVAARLGLAEDGLTQLVRARTGLTPAELRRRLRGA